MHRFHSSHLGALTIATALSLGTALVGCDDGGTPQTAGVPGSSAKAKAAKPKADSAVKEKAKRLASQVENAAFPSKDQNNKDNAEAFVYLARTHDKAEVVAAALKGMASTYTSNAKVKNKVMADGQYHKVVLGKVNNEDAKVQAAALQAAGHSISGESPDQEVLKALVELGSSHAKPEGRYAVLEQLWKVRNIQKDAAKVEPYVKALDAQEPWLVSGALFRLKSMASRYEKKDDLQAKLVTLLKHADPGVRGRAADVLGALAGNDDEKRKEIAALIVPLLDDENPYTKSAACGALAWMRHTPAIHKIMKMIEVDTKNTYDIREWKQLDGRSGWVHHDGSAWSRVGDAALYALMMLSNKTKVKFDYKVKAKTVDEDLKKAADVAKKWYAKVKAEIPTE